MAGGSLNAFSSCMIASATFVSSDIASLLQSSVERGKRHLTRTFLMLGSAAHVAANSAPRVRTCKNASLTSCVPFF